MSISNEGAGTLPARSTVSERILVISSCTALKLEAPHGRLCSAESLYTGQQHLRLMRGIGDYRSAGQPAGDLCFRILSALHGLLPPHKRIASYDHSLTGLSTAAIRREGREKNVPGDIRKILRGPFRLGIVLLGDSYLQACELDESIELGGPLLCFCSPARALRIPKLPELRTISLANAEARRFSCALLALKGELAGRLLSRLAVEPESLASFLLPDADVLSQLHGSHQLSA